jgi:serine/threonine-protein kinase
LQPDDPDAYYNRGLVYYMQEHYSWAIADYSVAIRLQPDDPDAYYNRGLAYYMQEQYTAALADWREYARLAGDSADPEILGLIGPLEDE